MAEPMSEQERRDVAYANRGEVIPGSATSIEGRRLGQVVSMRFEPESLILLREIAQRKGVTVSDLLREGAGMVIAREQEYVQITHMTWNVSVSPIQPTSWDPQRYPSSNPIVLPREPSVSA